MHLIVPCLLSWLLPQGLAGGGLILLTVSYGGIMSPVSWPAIQPGVRIVGLLSHDIGYCKFFKILWRLWKHTSMLKLPCGVCGFRYLI